MRQVGYLRAGAAQLRLADDRGKSRDAASRSFADFLPLVRRVARNRSG